MGFAVEKAPEIELDQAHAGDSVVVHNSAGEWVVSGTKRQGLVELRGRDGFTARFCETAVYDYDVASQEMAVHDAEHGRIFHDIRWARREPAGEQLKTLFNRMQRTVVAVISGR